MSLRIRRGTDAQRQGIVFDLGEILYTTDDQQLWVGDGITAGAINILATSAGSGLEWNPSTNTIELNTANLGINTSEVSEGSNKYFTTQRAQDAAASLFTTGQHTNISFIYDDVHGKLNATVTLDGVGILTVQSDVSPSLGGNLNLNSHSITGTGNISTTGTISASTGLGGNLNLNSHNITGTGNINVTGTITGSNLSTSGTITTTQGLGSNLALNGYNITGNGYISMSGGVSLDLTTDLQIRQVLNGIVSTGLTTTTMSRGSLASPLAVQPNDEIGGLLFRGQTSNSTSGIAGIFSVIVDPTAVINGGGFVKSLIAISAATDTSQDAENALVLDSAGVVTVNKVSVSDGSAISPSIRFSTDGGMDSGFFHPGDGIVCVTINTNEKARFDSGGLRVGGFIKVAQVSGALPSPPEAGMIVLDGTTFKGYNGSAWVNLN